MSYVAAAYVAVGVLAALLLGLWCATLYLLQRALTPKIFLSYRRADQETTGVPDRLWEDLHKRYGIENVFRDVYGILPGDSFERELHGRLSVCNVVVAVVGDDWEGRTSAEAAAQPWVMYQVVIGDDREGRTSADNSLRIQDPKDWVRYEVDHGRKEHKLLVVRAK